MNVPKPPLVSVLTPVYNGERYLTECIESVLAQGYPNWEYLILDNHSTDGTSEIARRYAEQDPRIRVLQPDRFVDVWENHHTAFRSVPPEAKYVKVIHADDWMYPGCLERMVQVAEAHPRVGIVSAYRLDDIRVSLTGLPYQRQAFPGREIARLNLLTGRFVFGSPSSLLFRADVVRSRDPYFEHDRFPRHADTASCLDILKDWDFGFVHQVLTYTRRHPESLSTSAARRNTYIAEYLTMLVEYGPHYLATEEFDARLRHRLKRYRRFLAKALLTERDPEFWALHKEALAEAGHPLRHSQLLGAGMMLALEITPGDLLRQLRDLPTRFLPRSKAGGLESGQRRLETSHGRSSS